MMPSTDEVWESEAVFGYEYLYEYGQHGLPNNGIEPLLKRSAAHDERRTDPDRLDRCQLVDLFRVA